MPTPLRRFRRRALNWWCLPVTLYMTWTGYVGLADHNALTQVFPFWLGLAWCIALVTGGAASTIGTLTRRSRLEASGHSAHLVALALYLALYLATNSASGTAGVLALIGVILARLNVLRYEQAARRLAAEGTLP